VEIIACFMPFVVFVLDESMFDLLRRVDDCGFDGCSGSEGDLSSPLTA
jgi:hypothetical protein